MTYCYVHSPLSAIPFRVLSRYLQFLNLNANILKSRFAKDFCNALNETFIEARDDDALNVDLSLSGFGVIQFPTMCFEYSGQVIG